MEIIYSNIAQNINYLALYRKKMRQLMTFRMLLSVGDLKFAC